MNPNEKDDLLRIRFDRLHEDAAEQARLMRAWSSKLALADKKAKLAKRKARVVRAELSKVVRQAPGKYGIAKVTDTAVEDAVIQMTTCKEADQEQIEMEYQRDMLKAMVMSIHERGEQISNEVKLFGQQYWAKPAVDPETYQEMTRHDRESVMRDINKSQK